MIPRDLRVIPTAALTATAIALLAFVSMFPRAAMWAGVVALGLAICGLFTLAKETVDLRADLADAERKAEVLTDALMAADQENAILSGRLEDVAEVPRLYAVPLPVADEVTPIHDRVPIDHWIEDVQTWGEDVER